MNPDSEVELPQRTQGVQREGCRAGPPGKNLAWFGTHQTRCPAVRFFAFFAANFGIRDKICGEHHRPARPCRAAITLINFVMEDAEPDRIKKTNLEPQSANEHETNAMLSIRRLARQLGLRNDQLQTRCSRNT
jgi:hypothetical protein